MEYLAKPGREALGHRSESVSWAPQALAYWEPPSSRRIHRRLSIRLLVTGLSETGPRPVSMVDRSRARE
jgi:hypothetical protein